MDAFLEQQSDVLSDAAQYYAASRENVTFVLDMLEALRAETHLIGDSNGARFWAGISDAVRAFAVASLLE